VRKEKTERKKKNEKGQVDIVCFWAPLLNADPFSG